MNTFLKRANDDFWKTIGCIQTNIKSKLGCGTPVIIKYYAPVNPEYPDEEIVYNFRSYGEDADLIASDPHQYCLKQCYKMCYYIQKVYQIEVLKMRTEFMKDENGTVRIVVLIKLDLVFLCNIDNSSVSKGKRAKLLNEKDKLH